MLIFREEVYGVCWNNCGEWELHLFGKSDWNEYRDREVLSWEFVDGWPRNFKFSFEKCTYYFEIVVALAVAPIPEGLPAVINNLLGSWQMFSDPLMWKELPMIHLMGKIEKWAIGQLDPNLQVIAKIAAICNDADIEKSGHDKSGHYVANGMPTEAALKVLVEKMGLPDEFGSGPSYGYDRALRCSYVWNKIDQRIATLEFVRDRKGSHCEFCHCKKYLLVKATCKGRFFFPLAFAAALLLIFWDVTANACWVTAKAFLALLQQFMHVMFCPYRSMGFGYDWAIPPTIAATGVSVNFGDANGWTALHWAAYYRRECTVAFVISLGAALEALTDPTPTCPAGRPPAQLSVSIAGHLSESLVSSLSSHILSLNLEDSKESIGRGKAVETVCNSSWL
ncbi:UNVERIFIED_CONTAM: Calcium-transporting ATPase 4, endoplasmic reticulum-type [Sesamum latifolium]|uniref:Calcium-transporting ATPase 4, endoplasmic reticulum-type n=1 Tax=Sesamum latifolium TaxID=2727402 RepID=A0AAW2U456_9LAMI